MAKIKPIKLVNSGCGDELLVYLKIKNGKIVDGRFLGEGCAISKASADLFLGIAIGRRIDELAEIRDIFEEMIVGKIDKEQMKKIGDLKALKCVSRMPARAACAKLVWKSLDLKNANA